VIEFHVPGSLYDDAVAAANAIIEFLEQEPGYDGPELIVERQCGSPGHGMGRRS